MMTKPLPQFRYYEDPVSTGSIVDSEARCICCGEYRGFIYAGPAYAVESYSDCFCPWCISDGSAHEKFSVEFNTRYAMKTVPKAVVDEILFRTPGFLCLQQGDWQEHCEDAAMFVGVVGKDHIDNMPSSVLNRIRETTGVVSDECWAEILDIAGDRNGIYRIYLFRCLKCSELKGFVACD